MNDGQIINIVYDNKMYAFDLYRSYELLEAGDCAFLYSPAEVYFNPRRSPNNADRSIPCYAVGETARGLWKMLCTRAIETGQAVDAGVMTPELWDLSERLAEVRREIGIRGLMAELEKSEEMLSQLEAQSASSSVKLN